MIKLSKVSFYQSIELQFPGKKINGNTISAEVYEGIEMRLHDHIITVSHPNWDVEILVGTSNMRYAVVENEAKKIVKTISLDLSGEMAIPKKATKKPRAKKKNV